MHRLLLTVAAMICTLAGSALAQTPAAIAQTWPSKPVRIIVPWPPSGLLYGVGDSARSIAENIAKRNGGLAGSLRPNSIITARRRFALAWSR